MSEAASYKELAIAVIEQSLKDLRGGTGLTFRTAWRFFSEPGSNFHWMATGSELDPEWVRDYARKAIDRRFGIPDDASTKALRDLLYDALSRAEAAESQLAIARSSLSKKTKRLALYEPRVRWKATSKNDEPQPATSK